MAAHWHFTTLRPGEKTRNPIQGEFFAMEAIRNPAEALIREALQNSLDAGIKDTTGQPIEMVQVRISLASGQSSADSNDYSEFFLDSWSHYEADGNGLSNAPARNERCPYLVIEDFGTYGLIGDVNQWHDKPGVKNSFFYFYRAEGLTGKGGEDRGRWGIGKYVFPRSSRISSFFGLTVREGENRRLLMGQAVLKTHQCGSQHYKPDGGFGEVNRELVLPITDSATIDRFCDVFGVTRRNEPGLSIVIPWVDPEITFPLLLEAVVRGYFYPILEGRLEVIVSDSSQEIVINESSLVGVVQSLDQPLSAELLPLLDLATWAVNKRPNEILALNPVPPTRAPNWSVPDLIPASAMAELQAQLELGEKVALKIPLTVRPKKKPDARSHFHLFLVRDGSQQDRTVFVREGIIIPDVRARRARGVRSLVVIDHQPLATLLGDSENPAHTEWQKGSSNFKDKYTYGKSYLDFVTHCASYIVNLLDSQHREEDVTLLKDFFSLPAPQSPDAPKTREKRAKKNPGNEPPKPPDPPEPRRRRYRLEKVAGGFRVRNGDPDAEVPALLDIRTAYDVRRGNPFKKYNTADFKLDDPGIRLNPPARGVTVLRRTENQMLVEVIQRDFSMTVTGFDEQRDLCVTVNVKEGNEDAEAV